MWRADSIPSHCAHPPTSSLLHLALDCGLDASLRANAFDGIASLVEESSDDVRFAILENIAQKAADVAMLEKSVDFGIFSREDTVGILCRRLEVSVEA